MKTFRVSCIVRLIIGIVLTRFVCKRADMHRRQKALASSGAGPRSMAAGAGLGRLPRRRCPSTSTMFCH